MFKALNQWVLNRLVEKSGEPVVAAIGLRTGGFWIDFHRARTGPVQRVSLNWNQVDSMVAVREASYVGDTVVVLLTHDNGRVLLNEHITGFAEFMAGCAGKLNGVEAPGQWQLELLAKELGVGVVIYARNGKAGHS